MDAPTAMKIETRGVFVQPGQRRSENGRRGAIYVCERKRSGGGSGVPLGRRNAATAARCEVEAGSARSGRKRQIRNGRIEKRAGGSDRIANGFFARCRNDLFGRTGGGEDADGAADSSGDVGGTGRRVSCEAIAGEVRWQECEPEFTAQKGGGKQRLSADEMVATFAPQGWITQAEANGNVER